jgi:hypothetical protein
MMEELSSPKRRFLQEPHGVTSQRTPFLIVLLFAGTFMGSSSVIMCHACHELLPSAAAIGNYLLPTMEEISLRARNIEPLNCCRESTFIGIPALK